MHGDCGLLCVQIRLPGHDDALDGLLAHSLPGQLALQIRQLDKSVSRDSASTPSIDKTDHTPHKCASTRGQLALQVGQLDNHTEVRAPSATSQVARIHG